MLTQLRCITHTVVFAFTWLQAVFSGVAPQNHMQNYQCSSSHTHTHNHTQFDFIQMLSLQPPCDQLSTMKPRAGPMLGRRWLVRDAITAAAITFSATESEQQFNVLVSRISNPQPVAAGALHEPDFVPVSRLVTLTTCLNNLQACGVSTIICS